MRNLAISVFLFFLGTVFGRAQSNLITNGAFANPGLSSATAVPFSTTAPTGWTYTIGSASGAGAYYAKTSQTTDGWIPWAPTGSTYTVQMDSASSTAQGTPDTISQVVLNLKSGQKYTVTFSMAGEADLPNDSYHPLTTELNLIVTGGTSGTQYVNGSYTNTQSAYGLSQSATVWSTYSVSFTPTQNESVTMEFQDNSASVSNNFSLANVTLYAITPEVSHWSIFAMIGVVCTAGEWRRRRRQALSDTPESAQASNVGSPPASGFEA